MDEPKQMDVNDHVYSTNKWSKHRFVFMVIGAIMIALSLVAISLSLYVSSGAAQLDLSRPGYSDVRDQIKPVEPQINFFPATGPINDQTLEEFQALYEEYAKQATSIDAFGGDPLGDISENSTD